MYINEKYGYVTFAATGKLVKGKYGDWIIPRPSINYQLYDWWRYVKKERNGKLPLIVIDRQQAESLGEYLIEGRTVEVEGEKVLGDIVICRITFICIVKDELTDEKRKMLIDEARCEADFYLAWDYIDRYTMEYYGSCAEYIEIKDDKGEVVEVKYKYPYKLTKELILPIKFKEYRPFVHCELTFRPTGELVAEFDDYYLFCECFLDYLYTHSFTFEDFEPDSLQKYREFCIKQINRRRIEHTINELLYNNMYVCFDYYTEEQKQQFVDEVYNRIIEDVPQNSKQKKEMLQRRINEILNEMDILTKPIEYTQQRIKEWFENLKIENLTIHLPKDAYPHFCNLVDKYGYIDKLKPTIVEQAMRKVSKQELVELLEEYTQLSLEEEMLISFSSDDYRTKEEFLEQKQAIKQTIEKIKSNLPDGEYYIAINAIGDWSGMAVLSGWKMLIFNDKYEPVYVLKYQYETDGYDEGTYEALYVVENDEEKFFEIEVKLIQEGKDPNSSVLVVEADELKHLLKNL